MRKDQTYCYRLSLVGETGNNKFYGLYTTAEEEHAPGSIKFSMGEKDINGQAVSRYYYGYPLNIKNVVCIWAFLITLACVCCNLIGKEEVTENTVWSDKLNKLLNYVKKYSFYILCIEIIGIVAAIIYICNNDAVHWDEAFTFQMVTKNSFWGIVQETGKDIHPPLYYLLVKAITAILGTRLIVFKLFSVFCALATMLLSMTLVRKRWGNKVAFLFNLILGLGPQFIYFAVDVRMYSLQMFFVMYCALLAYEIMLQNKPQNWILFTLSALGGAYTHYFAIIPLAIIYGYLLIFLIIANKPAIKRFVICCISTILGYLPWVSVMARSFFRQGIAETTNSVQFNLHDLSQWLFSTNIECSAYMGIILFAAAGIAYLRICHELPLRNKIFLIMCATNWIVTYIFCLLIAARSAHFWDNRYIYGSIGIMWLFIIICIIRQSKFSFYSLACWMVIMVLSAFTIQKARELGTVDYINAAHEVLRQVADEKVLLYNYNSYDVLYAYHLPDKEFIFIDDLDVDELDQNYIYFISWGGKWFSDDVKVKYDLQVEPCGTMRFEEGVAGVELYKVTFKDKELAG